MLLATQSTQMLFVIQNCDWNDWADISQCASLCPLYLRFIEAAWMFGAWDPQG